MTVDCLVHVHSSFSYDSKTDLADIARVARAHGIRCVLMSEHNNFMTAADMERFVKRCDELSDDALLIVPGLELAFDANRIHLLAFGVRKYIGSVGPECTFASLVTAIREAGGVAVLAHPSHRQAIERIDPGDLDALDGIEIWNVKNGNRFFPTTADVVTLHNARKRSARPLAFAGVDWHHLDKFARVVLRVDTPGLRAGEVLQALRAGTFSIRGGLAAVPSTGEIGRSRALVYRATSAGLKKVRTTAYRWQSSLERKGFTTPRLLKDAARRLF